jgi:NAD(P)-dependent dehydrogenase (short-subunit alcohol dehydrogenase family)
VTQLLAGKHALVVGASSGIGKAIALRLSAEGAKVVVAARRQDQGDEVVADIERAGGQGVFLNADVTSTESISQLVEKTIELYGCLDIAVNNAGIEGTTFVPTADYDEATFDSVIDTNLKGV